MSRASGPGVLTPCAVCGEPTERTRCPEHEESATRARDARRGTFEERGYDHRWRALSKRARRAQPFCTDCGTRKNLTTDHLPIAWWRKEHGLAIRLQDVEVCCADCNSKRGESRPGSQRYQDWEAQRSAA